jgi:hypothetical protein
MKISSAATLLIGSAQQEKKSRAERGFSISQDQKIMRP